MSLHAAKLYLVMPFLVVFALSAAVVAIFFLILSVRRYGWGGVEILLVLLIGTLVSAGIVGLLTTPALSETEKMERCGESIAAPDFLAGADAIAASDSPSEADRQMNTAGIKRQFSSYLGCLFHESSDDDHSGISHRSVINIERFEKLADHIAIRAAELRGKAVDETRHAIYASYANFQRYFNHHLGLTQPAVG